MLRQVNSHLMINKGVIKSYAALDFIWPWTHSLNSSSEYFDCLLSSPEFKFFKIFLYFVLYFYFSWIHITAPLSKHWCWSSCGVFPSYSSSSSLIDYCYFRYCRPHFVSSTVISTDIIFSSLLVFKMVLDFICWLHTFYLDCFCLC